MSTEFLNRYKVIYSEYISHAVLLHNYHMLFCKQPSYEGGLQIRKALRNMMKIEREMLRINLKAFYEYEKHVRNLNRQEKRRIQQEERLKRRKYVKRNTTTTEPI